MVLSFKDKRKSFYEQIPNYWADLYGQEYSLFDILEVTEEQRNSKQLFAYRSGKIFFKVCDLLSNGQISDDILLELGFPKETLEFIRLKTIKGKTIIGRFDSVEVNGVEKLLEFNSDTPTFIKELFYINGLVCKELGYENPNKNEENKLVKILQNVIIEAISKLGIDYVPNIVFTSHDDSTEDKNTLLYLQEKISLPSKFVPLNKLRIIENEGLYDAEGFKIDVLYRQTFPIESMILDKDLDSGDNIGLMLLDLVKQGKLSIINPPSAFLMQSKALMAVIWGLHEERSSFFTDEEHEWIQLYFLPTYLEPDKFIEQNQKYVKKPVFGREGDTVEVYSPNGEKILEDKNKSYTEYVSVYQKYVDLPKVNFKTEQGIKEGHVMTGTFLLNGVPSAFGFRVGNQITDNLSYFLPCGIKKQKL